MAEEDESGEDEDKNKEAAESSPMDPAMMEQFYRDMKLGISVEVGGSIVDTDADFRSGSAVQLVDIDFNSLMETPEALDLLNNSKMKTLEEMKAFSRKYPGLRLETKDAVKIRFR
jgi:hypothetical protein